MVESLLSIIPMRTLRITCLLFMLIISPFFFLPIKASEANTSPHTTKYRLTMTQIIQTRIDKVYPIHGDSTYRILCMRDSDGIIGSDETKVSIGSIVGRSLIGCHH